jgi:hypothetical protein
MKKFFKYFGIAVLVTATVFTMSSCPNDTTEVYDIESLLQGTTWIKEGATHFPKIIFLEDTKSPGPGKMAIDLWCPIGNHVYNSSERSVIISGNNIYDSNKAAWFNTDFTVDFGDNGIKLIITNNVPKDDIDYRYFLAGTWIRQD